MLDSCNQITMEDIYRDENLPASTNGIVKEKILYKGGNVTLIIMNSHKTDSAIAVASRLNNFVQIGDKFVKVANSNKCIIQRKNSIMYIDCYDIPEEIRDSLGIIDEWPSSKKGHWLINKGKQ